MNHRDNKDHNYPKSNSSSMKKADNKVMGDATKKSTDNGPHLKTGKSTNYNQMSIPNGFMTHDSRPGHSQKSNIDDK